MKKSSLFVLLVASLLLSACGAPAAATIAPTEEEVAPTQAPATEETEPTAETAAELPTSLAITATAAGYEASQSVASGWVEVSLTNQGEARRQAAIFRFEEGKTVDDLAAALQSGEPGIPRFLTAMGGPAGVMPGASGSVVLHLLPGDYVILDPEPDETGVPALAKGFLLPFSVAEEDNGAAEPQADLMIDMADYSFVLDPEAIHAGQITIQVMNSGPVEPHEMAVIRLDEGASVQDFLAATSPDAPPGPPPGRGAAGLAALSVGEVAYVTLDLEAGVNYGLICFFPSFVNEGMPHFMLGMVNQFAVPAE